VYNTADQANCESPIYLSGCEPGCGSTHLGFFARTEKLSRGTILWHSISMVDADQGNMYIYLVTTDLHPPAKLNASHGTTRFHEFHGRVFS